MSILTRKELYQMAKTRMDEAADILKKNPKGITAREACVAAGEDDGAIRKRFTDLKQKGRARKGPEQRQCTVSGKIVKLWFPTQWT